MLEPTPLAARLGFGKNHGYRMNRLLESLSWQVKRIDGTWEPTEAGRPYCAPPAGAACSPAARGGARSGQAPLRGAQAA